MDKRFIWFIISALLIGLCLFAWIGGWKEGCKISYRQLPSAPDGNGNGNGNGGNGEFLCTYEDYSYPPANGDTVYVDTSGDDSRTKEQAKNPATPWETIQKAEDNVVAGDWVIVGNGTYRGSGIDVVEITKTGASDNWIIFKSANLHGARLTGDNMARDYGFNIDVPAAYIMIEGFEIDSCEMGGIWTNNNISNFIYRNNKIHAICKHQVEDTYGRLGIHTKRTNKNIVIDGNIIYDIGRLPTPPVESWDDDYKHDHGLYIQGYNLLVINNIIFDCGAGWAIKADGNNTTDTAYSHVIVNNTMATLNWFNPQRPSHIRLFKNADCTYFPYPYIANNIFYDQPVIDSSRHAIDANPGTNYSAFIYNCLTNQDSIIAPWMNEDSMRVINCYVEYNPYFVDLSDTNFHLTDSSPCIDSGFADSIPDYDLDMHTRQIGDSVDIGVYEYCEEE